MRSVRVLYTSSIALRFHSFSPGLDLDESIVVTGLHDGVVHREGVVEVDVRDVLRKCVLAQSNDLFHAPQVVRLVAQFLQRLLSEVQVDVDVLRVVDVDVVDN